MPVPIVFPSATRSMCSIDPEIAEIRLIYGMLTAMYKTPATVNTPRHDARGKIFQGCLSSDMTGVRAWSASDVSGVATHTYVDN